MSFLFDANFSPKLVSALKALDPAGLLHHSIDHLPPDASDKEVFELARGLGAILLTKDRKILRRPHELAAYRTAGIGAFIFTGTAQRTLRVEASFMIDIMDQLERHAQKLKPPFTYRVTDKKKFEALSP